MGGPFRALRAAVLLVGFGAVVCWSLAPLAAARLVDAQGAIHRLCAINLAAAIAGVVLGVVPPARTPRFLGALPGSAPWLLFSAGVLVFLPLLVPIPRLLEHAFLVLWRYGLPYVLWPLVGAAFACRVARAARHA